MGNSLSASSKSKWLLSLLAFLFSISIVTLLILVLRQSSLFERIETVFGGERLEFLPLPGGEEEQDVPVPFAVLVTQADTAFALGNLSEALSLYDRALTLSDGSGFSPGSDVPVIRKLFHTTLLLRDWERAEAMLGLLSFRGVSEEALDALRGFLLLHKGEKAGAQHLFQKYPENPEHLYGLALLSLLQGTHEETEQFLSMIREKSSDPVLVHAAQTLQGAYDEFALFEDGKNSHQSTLLARALAQLNQCPFALELLEGVMLSEPDYRDAWIIKGYCTLILQETTEALEAFEKAYSLDPEKSETQYFLGLTHERMGKMTEARTFLSYALQNGFQPERAIREKLATIAEAEGAYEDAAAEYQSLLELGDENLAETYHALVTLLIEHLNQTDEARTLALEARERLGDVPLVLDLLGWTELLRDDVNQAAAYLTVAVTQDPTLASAWYHKGLLAERVGDRDEAFKSYREAYILSIGSNPELATKAAEKHNALVMGKE